MFIYYFRKYVTPKHQIQLFDTAKHKNLHQYLPPEGLAMKSEGLFKNAAILFATCRLRARESTLLLQRRKINEKSNHTNNNKGSTKNKPQNREKENTHQETMTKLYKDCRFSQNQVKQNNNTKTIVLAKLLMNKTN